MTYSGKWATRELKIDFVELIGYKCFSKYKHTRRKRTDE
tara:strand:+ start:614 stop:730 length:117 start_codon:yes stop_codon:yes gene_type:complete